MTPIIIRFRSLFTATLVFCLLLSCCLGVRARGIHLYHSAGGCVSSQSPENLLSNAKPRIQGSTSSETIAQFEGIHNQFGSFGASVPDTHGTCGTNGILAVSNEGFSYYSKAGIYKFGIDHYSLFGVPSDAYHEFTDPKALYDPAAGRFYIAMLEIEATNNPNRSFLHVAVSKTSDIPNGSLTNWFTYSFETTQPSGTNYNWSDYTCIGFDNQALYVTYNMYPLPFDTTNGHVNVEICIMSKSAITNGTPNFSTVLTPVPQNLLTNAFSLQPCTVTGSGDPGNVAYFAETLLNTSTNVRIWALSDPLGAKTLTSSLVTVPNNGGTPYTALQPGTTNMITMDDARTQGNAFWINGAVWFCHSAGGSAGKSIVYYYKVNCNGFPSGTPTLAESAGIDGGPGVWTFCPSVGANPEGDVCLTFCETSTNMFPTICYTLHPAGSNSFELPAQVLKVSPTNAIVVRWGDYSTVVADPVDGTFWVANEWANYAVADDWSTWWGHVSDKVSIQAQPSGRTIVEGNTNTFSVTASGSSLSYQWQKNGTNIPSATASSYTLAPAMAADSGTYSVIVSNVFGSITSSNATFIVYAIPVITGIFSTNGTPITNGLYNTDVLIRGVGLTNLGYHSVRIGWTYFDYYQSGSSTQLNATLPAHYLLDPIYVTTPGGTATSAVFSVTCYQGQTSATDTVGSWHSIWTSPSSYFSYQWYKNGVPLTNDSRISGATYTTLNINGLQTNDAGTYYVTAAQLGRTAQSTNITLTISGPKPNITFLSGTTYTYVGANGTFSVSATGDLPLSYQWYYNGSAMTNGNRVVGATNSSMSVTNVQVSDAGSYHVTVTGATGGTTISSDTVMRVSASALTITNSPTNITYSAGANAIFRFGATGGTAPLTYQWKKNSVPLSDSSHIVGSATTVLTVVTMVTNDAGTYSVTATDAVGASIGTSATLILPTPPVFTSQPLSLTNRAGSSVFWSVSASGASPITYQWVKNGAQLSGQTMTFLSLSSVGTTDAGSYCVVASNSVGTATSSVATLTVYCRTNFSTNATFAWILPFGGTNHDYAQAIATDPSGNVIMAGNAGMPLTFGSSNVAVGTEQLVVAKLTPAGSVVWLKTSSGTGWLQPHCVATDPGGNVVISGEFSGTNFFGAAKVVSAGTDDLFLTRLDSAGNFLWATNAGRTNSGWLSAVQMDSVSNVYWGSDFVGTLNLGTNNLTSNGRGDLFVTKLTANGQFQWAKHYGGTNYDYFTSLRIDRATTNLYFCGELYNAINFGVTNLTATGALLGKMNSNGDVQWVLGGTNGDWGGEGVAVDSSGNSYLTGESGRSVSFGALTVTNAGYGFTYLVKVSSTGTPLWLRKVVCSGGGNSIALDNLGRPVVGGWEEFAGGDDDIFLGRFDTNGNLVAQSLAGGGGTDLIDGLATASDGSIYLAGQFQGADIGGAAFGTNLVTGFGKTDGVIAKITGWGQPLPLRIQSITRLNNGTSRIVFSNTDHSPIDYNLQQTLCILATDDLNLPMTSWQRLTSVVVLPNGELQLDDASVLPKRFYLLQGVP